VPSRGLDASLAGLAAQVAAEQADACSVPRGGGWRPGARWAKSDAIDAPPRPLRRKDGRMSEAAEHPFKRLRGDDGGTPGASRLRGEPPRGGGSDAPPSATTHTPHPACPHDLSWADHRTPLLVTSHRIGARVEIAAACEHARALGIRAGMALTQARAQTPGLMVHEADHEGDFADLMQLATMLARRFAPIVAIDGTAGLLIDITGTAHLHGGERAMAAKLVRQLRVRGYAARVAIADTPAAAHALARHGRGAIIVSHDDAAALAPLPIQALRLDPVGIELLRRLGIDRIDQLAAVARGPLARRLGEAVITRIDQAFGHRPEPLVPIVPPEPIAVTQRFAEPIATAEAIEHWLGVLVPRLTDALSAAGLGARRIEVIADRIDAVPQRIRVGLARPNREPKHLLRLLIRRIGDVEPGYGIDAITLHLRAADRLGPETLAPELAEDGTPDLAPLVDTLATRGAALWRQQPIESDVPERSTAPAPPLDPPARHVQQLEADDVRRLDLTEALHPWHPRWPRPVRLLARPERLDHVLAEMPDKPPLRFTWRGRPYRVVRADGPERIAGEWWRRSGERSGIRDYFQVEDDTGARFWLYRRGDGVRAATGDLAWFLHGWFG
jgi:protein ImuB